MRKSHIVTCVAMLLILACVLLTACKKTTIEKITDVAIKKDNLYTCNFRGVEHEFLVCNPLETSETTTQSSESAEARPLVIMLHGYSSTAKGFQSMTHFDEDANKKGYVVCYVTSVSNPNNKLDVGWNSKIGDSDKDDLEFLVSLTNYLQEEYNCDKSKTYVVGYSNGAFMVHRLASEAADTFTKCVSVAGMMPQKIWEAKSEKSNVSFLQVYGTLDDVVPQKLNGSDKTSPHPAIEDVMAYRATACDMEQTEVLQLSEKAKLTKYEKNATKVWTVVIDGGRHSWPEKNFAGFSVNELVLDFLEN